MNVSKEIRTQCHASRAVDFRIVESRSRRTTSGSKNQRQTSSLEMARRLRQPFTSKRENYHRQRQRRKTGDSARQSRIGGKGIDDAYDAVLVSVDSTRRSRSLPSPHHGGDSIYSSRQGRLHERRRAENGHGRRRFDPHAAVVVARARA